MEAPPARRRSTRSPGPGHADRRVEPRGGGTPILDPGGRIVGGTPPISLRIYNKPHRPNPENPRGF